MLNSCRCSLWWVLSVYGSWLSCIVVHCVDIHTQDPMQMLICHILFGCVVDECYCQLVIQTHQLASIQSIHILDGECDGKYA